MFRFLARIHILGARRRLCVLNTDNLPFNGDAIRGHVRANSGGLRVQGLGFASMRARVKRVISLQ